MGSGIAPSPILPGMEFLHIFNHLVKDVFFTKKWINLVGMARIELATSTMSTGVLPMNYMPLVYFLIIN